MQSEGEKQPIRGLWLGSCRVRGQTAAHHPELTLLGVCQTILAA